MPQNLKVEKLDDETFIVRFPVGTEWNTRTSEVFGGLIKTFTYVPYDDGAGDLVIKTDPSLALRTFGLLKDKNFNLSFNQATQEQKIPLTNPLVINNLRIGQKNGRTRIVFDMNHVVDFVLKENQEGTKIILIPSEKPLWKPKTSLTQSIGLFEKYTVYDNGRELAIEFLLKPHTKVAETFLMDVKTDNPRFIVDLDTLSDVSVIDPVSINATQEANERASGFFEKEESTEEVSAPVDVLVKKMDIIAQSDDTILKLETIKDQNYSITENTYMNQVIIHLPKTNWKNVIIPRNKGGLIQGFTVDQTSPDVTNLVLTVQKGTHVTGKKVFGKGSGLPRFIIYLNQEENKTPEWLIEETTEKTPYYDRELDELRTSRIIYRGGISPYINVGEGFYLGIQGDQLATENTSHSQIYTSNRRRYLSGNNFGGGAHLYTGYGVSYDRFYGGLELRLGGYGVDEKTYYRGTNTYNSSSEINFTWDVSTRLGAYISPTTLAFGRLGVTSTNFSYDGSNSADGIFIFPGSFAKNARTGFLFGFGLESAVTDQFSVRLEANQINYQGIQYSLNNGTKKDRNILNQVSLGMSYKPNPMSCPAMGNFFEESTGTGLYFGLDTGMGNMMNARQVDGKSGATTTYYEGQSGSSEPIWGIFGGYSYNIGRFFLAAELQMGLNQILIKEYLSNGTSTTDSYSNKLKWLWSAGIRPGYIFNHGTIAYARLGILGATLTHKTDFSSSTVRQFASGPNTTERIWGLRTGGGIEVFVNPNVSVRADYIFDYMPRTVFKDPTVSGVEERVNIINNQFKIGLAYTLP